MRADVAGRWTWALRSGNYSQGKGLLRDRKGNFCCLGVLCDIAEEEGIVVFDTVARTYDGKDEYLPESVQIWAGIFDRIGTFNQSKLTELNDDYEIDFDGIARVIEEIQEEL